LMNRAAMELMPYQKVCPANCLMLKLKNVCAKVNDF
jgi:hypothetical protein